MADVLSIIELISRLESVELTVHQQRCTRVRNRNSSCSRCADACTSQAISLGEASGASLELKPERCVGCGVCATVCPTAALEARNPSDVELMRSCVRLLREGGQRPVIACSPLLRSEHGGYDRSGVVEVRCLGRVEESLLVTLAALGAEAIILCCGDCPGCESRNGEQTWRLVQQTFASLMRAWGRDDIVETSFGLPPELAPGRQGADGSRRPGGSEQGAGDGEQPGETGPEADYGGQLGLSRRQFFTRLKDEGLRTVAATGSQTAGLSGAAPRQQTAVTKVMRDGTLPHFIPGRRERLLDKLELLGRPVADSLDTRLWGHMRYDEQLCDSCRMCAAFCPTGAIYKFDDPDGSFGIEHYPADCVQCRLCQDICPKQAITIRSDVGIRELLEGVIERHEMKPPLRTPSAPDSIITAVKQLFNDSNINDRP